MISTATYDDANLILRLYDMRREERLRAARAWFSANFKCKTGEDVAKLCPMGSEENASYRMVVTYWEMVAVFVHRGLLDRDLLFETAAEFHIFWIKARATILDLRKLRNMPFYLKNLEDLADEHKAFIESKAPGSSAFFASLNKRPAQTKT